MQKIVFVKRKALTVLVCALVAVGMFAAVNSPAIVGAAATTRQLPIYRVQRDQKMLSISFDAAWAEAILRHINPIINRTVAAGLGVPPPAATVVFL